MNNRINMKLKYIIFAIIISILVLLGGYYYISNAVISSSSMEPTEFGAKYVDSENQLGYYTVYRLVIKPYSYSRPSFTKIDKFPIDNYVFNSCPDYFCAQHGTPYASSFKNSILGKSPDFHEHEDTIVKHNFTSYTTGYLYTYSNNPKEDVPKYGFHRIYIDENGKLIENRPIYPGEFDGYKEATETAQNTLFTNWVFTPNDVEFDCEGKRSLTGPDGISGTGMISDGAMSFLLACYKQSPQERSRTTYQGDPLQHAVWDWLCQGGNTVLRAAAEAFDKYHEDSEKKPNVDTKPESNVGTTISGSTYTVGPFKMSNYVRAQDYSYNVDGHDDGVYINDSGSYGNYDANQDEHYNLDVHMGQVDLQSDFNRGILAPGDIDARGTIIKAEAVVTNESGATKKIEFPVPDPGSTYSINFSANEIEGYDELVDIIFTYQRVHSCGAGVWYDGQQKAITFDELSGSVVPGCSNYYCQGCYCKGGHYSPTCHECNCTGHPDSYTITNSDGTKTTVPYTRYCHCSGHTYSDGGNCPDPNGWCACPRNHSQGYIGPHGDQAICTGKGHSHLDCKYFKWNKPDIDGDKAQDGFAGGGLLTTEQAEFKVRVAIPLKTQMSIYKYIIKAEHVGEPGVIFDSEERRDRTMQEKYDDPVKVERGDLVTYKIELVNKSRFDTRVKVKDVLPEGCEPLYAGLVDCTLEEMPDNIKYSQWITVPKKDSSGESKLILYVKVRPTQPEGKYTNTIEFITKNDTDPHMQFTIWGDGTDGKEASHGPNTNGSIVNTRVENNTTYTTDLKEKDSDTYEIKQYNVNIDKYIYDVNHEQEHVDTSLLDTSISASDERSVENGTTEDMKRANPVYVEYGDIVTYYIKIYNTTNKYDASIDRTAAPYWEPDKVYVNIEDTLPKKYSDLKVTVDNGTGAFSEGNGKFTVKNIMVPPDGVTTVKVTLVVEEHEKGTIETNSVKFIDKIRNINKGPGNENNVDDKFCVVKNNPLKEETNDYYILNDYDAYIDKYLYTYDEKIKNENVEFGLSNEQTLVGANNVLLSYQNNPDLEARERLTDATKKDAPVPVEKDEIISYQIKVTNEATGVGGGMATSGKPATQVRTTRVTDLMEQGLILVNVEAKQYNADGSICDRYNIGGNVQVSSSNAGTVSQDGRTYTRYLLDITEDTILNPGEYIVYTVTAKVVESDLYLFDLDNLAQLTILTNINHKSTTDTDREIKNDQWDENISPQKESHEYVRMKDLIIAGKVWLDFNKNGLMDDTIQDYIDQTKDEEAFDYSKLSTYYNINSNAMMKDITVRLYKSDDTLVRTTKTDANGLFTFSKAEDGISFYETQYYNLDPNRTYSPDKVYERIDKASGKDGNGNYQAGAQYYSYYIEYEYDGLIYKATAYSGKDHLNDDGSYKGAPCGHDFETNTNQYATDDYKAEIKPGQKYKYEYDSNANEFANEREAFNERYVYISYNKAYDANYQETIQNGKNTSNLQFDKDGHESRLLVNPDRVMKARSFIEELVQPGGQEATNFIPLFAYDDSNRTIPYSRYLKFINLGLELREDVDISLTKDVYKVKTTIKGEEMEYNFNSLKDLINGKSIDGSAVNDYQLDKPYGIELYESDYKYRNEQYSTIEAVKNYFGQTSELNVEVTYRIRVDNNRVGKDDDLKDPSELGNGYNPENFEETDQTDTYVKIDEILDLYDENFIKYTPEMESNPSKAVINVRQMDPKTGRFSDTDKEIKIAEAWYYKQNDSGNYYLDEDSGIYIDTTNTNVTVPDGAQRYERVDLKISNNSKVTPTNEYINTQKYESYDGYNKLYITGMENEKIGEKEHLDIFVKYVLDKAEEEITVTNDEWQETMTEASSELYSGVTYDPTTGEYTFSWGSSSSSTTSENRLTTLVRSLRIAEHRNTPEKQAYGLETENIAQVNIYSVYYKTNDKPSALVDKDSNVGNIGINDEGQVDSADNKDIYEDTVYKTGISITSEGTANIPGHRETIGQEHDGGTIKGKLIRKMNGHVWDDSRTDEAEEQYMGNGLRHLGTDNAIAEAKKNELVPIIKGEDTTEDTDITVSSARAEFIEVVETAPNRYYEITPTDITNKYVQHVRTKEDGSYELEGYTPGKYVVRFTYGDNISASGDTGNQEDMYLFNGQDYKSTKYTMQDPETGDVLDDNIILYNNTNLSNDKEILEANSAKIDRIIEALEADQYNDARDDEIRRLEVNSYSEVMDNMMAEILQGMANGKNLTNNNHENSPEELNALVNNTWMFADTIPFTVRTEKISEILDNQTYGNRKYLGSGLIPTRTFSIDNIDFGIEYRPENLVQLEKELKEVKVTTESGQTVVDLFFITDYENTERGSVKTHYIDREKSVGADLVQFVSNQYNTLLSGLISEKDINQGFVYINYDVDIQQGATVEITYEMIAENHGEIDRISSNLDAIRYQTNFETEQLSQQTINPITKNIVSDSTDNIDINYRANKTAANDMVNSIYAKDANGAFYRTSPKVLTSTSGPRTSGQSIDANGASRNTVNYYGYYVGYAYYTGEVTSYDTVARLKFNKILDYVDKDMEYTAQTSGAQTLNKNWSILDNDYNNYYKSIDWARNRLGYVSSVSGNYTPDAIEKFIKNSIEELNVPSVYNQMKNTEGLSGQQTASTTLDGIHGASIDPEGYIYNNMVVTTDTSTYTDLYENADREPANKQISGTNPDLARFLLPTEADDNTRSNSRGRIELTVSKAISAETNGDELQYQNIAEVVEYTTLTGRRTNFAITIGNVDVREKDPDNPDDPDDRDPREYPQSIPEPDESTTEVVTLVPPQGLYGQNRVIREVAEIAKTGTEAIIIIGAVVAIIVLVTTFTIRKYKKRRIK